MNVHKIIAQHYNSVALLFSRYGYSGEINAATLNAMAEIHGKPFVMQLRKQVEQNNFVHYAAPQEIGIVPGFEGSNAGVISKGLDAAGNYIGMNPDYREEPVKPDLPPIYAPLDLPPHIIEQGIYNGDLPPVSLPPVPDMTAFTPLEPEPIKQVMQSTTEAPAIVAQQPAAEKKSWFEKNQKLVIGAAVFIVIIALIMRRPATVLK